MNIFKKFSLIIASVFVFACASFVLAGCGKDDDTCKLYVFATVGGYVKVDEHEEIVEFGDEGSKIFTYKEDSIIELIAIPNDGYCFVKWQFTDDLSEDYAHIANQSQIKIKLDEDEVVVKAEFALDTSIVKYDVTYPTSTTGYLIVPEDGYTINVREGSDFKFKVNLDADYSNSNIVVKANDAVITADNQGVYTISNITEDIVITVTGVELNEEEPIIPTPTIYGVFTQDTRFTIIPVNQDTCEVEEGKSFTFKIKLNDGYKYGADVAVKVGGTALTDVNGEYTIISVTKNTEVVVEGIEIIEAVEQAETYIFTLKFEDEIYDQVENYIPEVVELTIKESEKQAQYNAEDFVVTDSEFNEQYTFKEIIDTINELCTNLEVTGFTLGGLDFIVVNGETITINWDLLTVIGSNYELLAVTKAIE